MIYETIKKENLEAVKKYLAYTKDLNKNEFYYEPLKYSYLFYANKREELEKEKDEFDKTIEAINEIKNIVTDNKDDDALFDYYGRDLLERYVKSDLNYRRTELDEKEHNLNRDAWRLFIYKVFEKAFNINSLESVSRYNSKHLLDDIEFVFLNKIDFSIKKAIEHFDKICKAIKQYVTNEFIDSIKDIKRRNETREEYYKNKLDPKTIYNYRIANMWISNTYLSDKKSPNWFDIRKLLASLYCLNCENITKIKPSFENDFKKIEEIIANNKTLKFEIFDNKFAFLKTKEPKVIFSKLVCDKVNESIEKWEDLIKEITDNIVELSYKELMKINEIIKWFK